MDIRKELDDVLDDCDYEIIKFHNSGKGCGIREVTVVMQRKPFNLIDAWRNKESERIRSKLKDYSVYCDYEQGLLLIKDKGVLIDEMNIRSALEIKSNLWFPFVAMCCGNGVCVDTAIINMSRYMEIR